MTRDYCVVIPAHNEERFIVQAIESVHAQTMPAQEILVVDDGSTDRTAAVAEASGARVLRHGTAHGPSRSRNHAIAETTAPFVAFLDADDMWKPGHAARLLSQLDSQTTVFAGSRVETFGTTSGVTDAPFADDGARDIRDLLVTENPIIQSAVMVRRSVLEKVGGYDETLRLSEDYDLWTRIADHGHFGFVNEVTVRRRLHESQVTNRFRGELVRAWWGVRARTAGRRLKRAAADERQRIIDLLVDSARADVELAIWTGQGAMLTLVREELQRADTELGLGGLLTSIGGGRAPLLRVTQDARCRLKAATRRLGIGA